MSKGQSRKQSRQQRQRRHNRPATVTSEPPSSMKCRDAAKPARKTKPSRAELQHFGGYLDDDTLEKIALLRIRLKMDNSALIKHAIEELHRKHNAKRAFGDA